MANIDPLDLAYAAGLIDGEGTIGITEIRPGGTRADGRQSRKSPQHRIYVAMTMTDATCIMWMRGVFGGHFQSLKSRGINHKPTFRWSMTSKEAADFCDLIEPYLKLKRTQAQIASNFFRERLSGNFQGNLGVTQDELAARRALHDKIKKLNQRGMVA